MTSKPEKTSEQLAEDQLEYATIPDNSITVILKNDGKVFQKGLHLMKFGEGVHTEDLDSELAAVDTLAEVIKNTLKHNVNFANLPIPNEPTLEEQFPPTEYTDKPDGNADEA